MGKWKDLKEKEKRNFWFALVRRKKIVIINLEWILQKENQSHLKSRNISQRLVFQGMFLVTLKILAYIRFLLLVVSEYLMFY